MIDNAARVVPIRPLGVGELLDGAVRLVRATPAAAFAIGLPFALARTVVTLLVQAGTLHAAGAQWWGLLALVGSTGLFGTMRTGLLTPVYTATITGRPVTAVRTRPGVGASAMSLLGLALLVTVGEIAGLVLLVVGGLWLWGVWSVAAPAAASERLGPLTALRRSFALARGMFWRAWGLRALGFLVTYVISALLTIPFEALAGYLSGTDPLRIATDGISHPGVYLGVLAVGTLVAATVAGPISSAVDVLIYTDLRMRGEGLDIVMGLGARTAGPAAAA